MIIHYFITMIAQIMVQTSTEQTMVDEFDPPLDYNHTRESATTQSFVDFSPGGGEPPGVTRNFILSSTSNSNKQTNNTHQSTSFAHCILPTSTLQSVLEKNLIPCLVCNSKKRKAIITKSCTFAMNMAIVCEKCVAEAQRVTMNIRRIKQEQFTLRRTPNMNTRQSDANLRNQLNRRKQRLTKIKNNNQNNEVIPMHSRVGTDFTWDAKAKMVSFDLNIRAILGSFMIGTGGHDVGKLLTMMGIPGGSSFERGFYRHGQHVHDRIIKRCRAIIDRSLRDELKTTVTETWDAAKPHDLLTEALGLIDNGRYEELDDLIGPTPLSVSYDMGWQRRGGGRVFDSLSGHGYLMGCLNGKVIHAGVLKKRCSTCMRHDGLVDHLPQHKCNVNHSGSSGSMESKLALCMVTDICRETNGAANVGELVTDDDSTMRANLKHKTNNNKGKLDDNVPEPTFLADPGHRVKVMVKKLFARVSKNKDPNKIKNIDALRIKKYTACYITQKRTGDFGDFVRNALAPVEHMFDNHIYCDSSWCWSKEVQDKVHRILLDRKKSEGMEVSLCLRSDKQNRLHHTYIDNHFMY